MAVARQNLVAMGVAAVLTVYAAGYARTRDAAARFDQADQAVRRPTQEPATRDSQLVAAASASPQVARPAASPAVAESVEAVASPAVEVADSTRSAALTAADPVDPPTPAGDEPQPVAAVVTPPDSATPPAVADSATARPAWKDGEYYGWGTSRHGDIMAGIQIKEGRIVAAWIQQCLTRYSCSWIAKLPGQVVERQSPETDYVSGATQSTNAFYYAVVEALSRAK